MYFHLCRVSIHLDFYRRLPKRECRVQTANGELVWDALKQSVQWTTSSGQSTEKLFPQDKDYLFRRQMLHFFDCVQGVTQPLVSIVHGIQVMRMVDAVRQSHSSGRIVKL